MKARLGIAQAIATKEQVNAYGGTQYQVIQDVMTKFTDAIKEGKINIVPNNVVIVKITYFIVDILEVIKDKI